MADSRSIIERVRRRLPLGAQVGYGWLKNQFLPRPLWDEAEFIQYSAWLEKTQWWSKAELEALQLEKLKALIKHAYENVPYYQRVFAEQQLTPQDLVTLDDLQKFPVLTKETVRNNLEDLVARNVDRSKLDFLTTSGSTGVPLGVYQNEHQAYLHELGLVYRQRKWAGCHIGDRFVTLRGNLLPDADKKGKKAWWDYDPAHNMLTLSSHEMSDENLFQYVQKLKEFQPKYLHVYPSSVEILARFMKRNAFSVTSIQAIFCGSETVYPEQRKLIETVFGCRIFARYGMAEKVADAVECEQHNGYHVGMEYGVFELLDQHDERIQQPGIPGRVTGTGFDTYCMPLIRYVTSDVTEYAPQPCACQRQATLVKDFKGRLRELVISKSGYPVPLYTIDGSFHGQIDTKIREVKFRQERQGEIIALIAKAPNFSEAEVAQEFLNAVYERLDPEEFKLQVVFVESVPRTGRGKIGLLEQALPIELDNLDQFKN